MTGFAPIDHPRRCQKHRSDGEPCHRWAMVGQDCCWTHGGAASQNIRAARRRLLEASGTAINRLHGIVEDPASRDRDAISAGHVILRSAGLPGGGGALQEWLMEHADGQDVDAMTPAEQLDALAELISEMTGNAITADAVRAAVLAHEREQDGDLSPWERYQAGLIEERRQWLREHGHPDADAAMHLDSSGVVVIDRPELPALPATSSGGEPPPTTPTGGRPADQPEPNDQPRNRPWSGDPPAIDTSNVDWIFDD